MKPKNILSRSAGLCLLLSVVMALTSCGVWEWMWARRTEPEVNTNQLTVGTSGKDPLKDRAVTYKADTVHEGTDIYYVGNGENKDLIVVIDAGHQERANGETEPNGPGSTVGKAKVTQGATGVSTGQLEYELNLKVALFLRDELYARGYSVVMIRETNGVDVSNRRRAEIANRYRAAAYVRIHANSFEDATAQGALTMCQSAENPYPDCAAAYQASRLMSDLVLESFCEATGIRQREVQETDTLTGTNWATVPNTLVEMGFMSNAEEDVYMSGTYFQRQAALGIANGLEAYFEAMAVAAETNG